MSISRPILVLMAAFVISPTSGRATELIRITAQNVESIVPLGKEVDAIIGDWVLRNDQIVAVIAQPTQGRKANMTVRGVSGMIIDFTRRYDESDQLSCFYPAAGKYLFEDGSTYLCTIDGKQVPLAGAAALKGKEIQLQLSGSPIATDGSAATIRYILRDGEDAIHYQVDIENRSAAPIATNAGDSIRCDGELFQMSSHPESRLIALVDQFFGQGYGVHSDETLLEVTGNRPYLLAPAQDVKRELAPEETHSWSGRLVCSQGLPGILNWAQGISTNQRTIPMMLKLQSAIGPIEHAKVEFTRDGVSFGTLESDAKGAVRAKLLPGKYVATIKSAGREPRVHSFEIANSAFAETLTIPNASRIRLKILDSDQQPLAAKVQFFGRDGSTDPNFGPDSALHGVRNVLYLANGKLDQDIDPGKYHVIVSHGPEYDAVTMDIEVTQGCIENVGAVLPRVVDTRGWISADFHSHSTPSGDNVAHQTGRVLNLLAEQIEFAPCTEHNRIDTYEDDLLRLGVTKAMATCTGMELTGSLLPVNHQNAFPLHRHEHEQDGGGPQTDVNPITQIERLALWDNASDKLVQGNHPNIPQILGDRDLDGVPDQGFREMLSWMDVIEVHPAAIFTPPAADTSPKDKITNPIFAWLQLLNLGYRIPAVSNTDAHYNFHGSGWLRNYLASSTDVPSEISIDEVVHAAEHGHILMTTGPFLQAEVRLQHQGENRRFIAGEEIVVSDGIVPLWIRVQCPNWFDVNRVQVFANGRPVEELNFTRNSHPELFSNGVVRFELSAELNIACDTHLVVATIGEGLKLGPVMGPERGELAPAAVTNPIYLDYDGGGFQSNGDDLGVPVMLPPEE